MHGIYHKIPTIWKRNPDTLKLMIGHYSTPELGELSSLDWTWTEKIDGTNIRIGWDGDKVHIGGKTDRAQIPDHLMDKLASMFAGEANEQLFEQTFPNADSDNHITLYGEGYGQKIQKGGQYISDDVDFILFDVKVGHYWLRRNNVEDIARALGIEAVPVVGAGSLQLAHNFIADGKLTSRWKNAKPEGIVMRPPMGLLDRSGRRIIAKLKVSDLN